MIDKQTYIENDIISLMMQGYTQTNARREAENRFQYLYGDSEDDEEESNSEFFDDGAYEE